MSAARIRALVALDPGADREIMKSALELEPTVEIVGVADEADSWQSLQRTQADVLVVACGGGSESALALVTEAVQAHPNRPVVVVYAGSPNGFVPQVFDAGADDIVPVLDGSSASQVLFSLQKAVARRRGSAHRDAASLASMICVLGPKGGTGKTLTSVNLAIALADAGQRTAIVDLDLQFGDVGLAMGLRPMHTMYDLATSSGSLDAEKLDAFFAEHPSGVRALLAPTRPDQSSTVTAEFTKGVYDLIRADFDYLVVDTPPGFTPEVIACIDAATEICLVGTLDSLSLKNMKLGLETLRLMGCDPDHVKIVLNRANSRVGLSREDAATIIGRQPDAFVPSHREITRSMNEGNPIVAADKRSDAARAFQYLARSYIDARAAAATPVAAVAPQGRKLFARGVR